MYVVSHIDSQTIKFHVIQVLIDDASRTVENLNHLI